MSSIFLAHNSKDKKFVKRLGKLLAGNGIRVWIDEAEMKPGKNLLDSMISGIKSIKFLGVVLSPSSVKSPWVQFELRMAQHREIKKRKIQIIPILYKKCAIPDFLQTKVYVDFRFKKNFYDSLMKLLDTISPIHFKNQFFDLIQNAATSEFKANTSLPVVYLEEIDKYFTSTGSARKRIMNYLNKHKMKGWVIDDSETSTFEIYDIKLLYTGKNTTRT